jgi:HEAT repeat protein
MLPVQASQRGKPRVILQKRKLLIFSAVGVSVLVLTCVALLFVSWQRGGEKSNAHLQGRSPGMTLPTLPTTIEGDVRVRVLSARMKNGSESLTYPWSGTLRVWSLRLVLRNEGATDLVLGNVCALFECNADGSSYEGLVEVRPNADEATGSLFANSDLGTKFGVSNYQENDDDNEARFSIRGSLITISGQSEPVNPSFGPLRAGKRLVLCLDFKLGTMLRDEFLNSVYLLSPLLYPPGAQHGPASLVLCEFRRPSKSGTEGEAWRPGKTSLLSLDFDSLAATAQDNRAQSFRRTVAVTLLAQLYPSRACETLRTRLSTVNESCGDVRAAAIVALGQLKDTGAMETLCKIVGDAGQPGGIRRLSAKALGNFSDPKVVAALTSAARDNDEHVSSAAISALGETGGEDGLASLQHLLADERFARSAVAASALGHCGEKAVAILAQGIADKRVDVAAASASALGHVLTAQSPRDHKSQRDQYRNTLEKALDMNETKAEKMRRLRDGKPAIPSEQAAVALGALDRAVQSKETKVADAAVAALAEVPGTQAADILTRALESGTGPMPRIIGTLVERGERRTDGKLIELATKGNQEVRSAAVSALGELKVDAASPTVTRILADKANPDALRRAALSSLKKLAGSIPEATLLTIAAERQDPLRWSCLEELAKSDSPQAREAVGAALAETGEQNKWRRDGLKRSADQASRASAPRPLADRLNSSSPEDRRQAIREIVESRDSTAISALKRAIGAENDRSVLWAMNGAIRALKCRDADLVPVLIQKLKPKGDSTDADTTLPAASMLRYITGIQNGPFASENDAEWADDIAAWKVTPE